MDEAAGAALVARLLSLPVAWAQECRELWLQRRGDAVPPHLGCAPRSRYCAIALLHFALHTPKLKRGLSPSEGFKLQISL